MTADVREYLLRYIRMIHCTQYFVFTALVNSPFSLPTTTFFTSVLAEYRFHLYDLGPLLSNVIQPNMTTVLDGKFCIQVNLFQNYSFLNQLTHNMTTDCSLIPDFSTRKIQVENMLCTKIVLKAKTKTKNNFCTHHVLNLYFSCTEVSNQWTICRHIMG